MLNQKVQGIFLVVHFQARIHNVDEMTNLVQILPDLTKHTRYIPGSWERMAKSYWCTDFTLEKTNLLNEGILI